MDHKEAKYSLIVHGGAWDIPVELHEEHIRGVKQAAEAGLKILRNDGSALNAVLEAVKSMENNPVFDAGTGSFLNRDGEVEMDAIIMDGTDLSFGAVAAIKNVKNPVETAELIRIKSEHCLLAGKGALDFAQKNNIPLCQTEDLLVGRELKRYRELIKKKKFKTKEFFEKKITSDTVGAVAYDRFKNIAVATSTGGTPNKLPGRVGDSPIIGAGAYADNGSAGASSTGWGESILKVVLAKTACDLCAQEYDAQKAARLSVDYLNNKVDGRGGIIILDKYGRIGWAFNTPYMARAAANEKGIIFSEI